MIARIALSALLVATSFAPALAQSASSTNFQTRPMQTSPTSGAQKNTKTPTRGIRFGQDAIQDGDTITIKRNK